jgi:hypothetical protein
MITSPLKSKMSDQSVPLAGIAAAPTRSRNYRAESAWHLLIVEVIHEGIQGFIETKIEEPQIRNQNICCLMVRINLSPSLRSNPT